MITEKELFDQGWRRYGDDDNDPYYKLLLEPKVFSLHSLSGILNSNGVFTIYNMNLRKFYKISELEDVMKVNKFVIDWKTVNRYGSKTELK